MMQMSLVIEDGRLVQCGSDDICQTNNVGEEGCLHWLSGFGVGERGLDVCRRLFEIGRATPGFEPWERSKCILLFDGRMRQSGWSVDDAELLGIYDESLDYHTLWDRKWAAINGYPKDEAVRVDSWDYARKEAVFA